MLKLRFFFIFITNNILIFILLYIFLLFIKMFLINKYIFFIHIFFLLTLRCNFTYICTYICTYIYKYIYELPSQNIINCLYKYYVRNINLI